MREQHLLCLLLLICLLRNLGAKPENPSKA